MSARERSQELVQSPARRVAIHRAADLDPSSSHASANEAPAQMASTASVATAAVLGLQRSHGNRFVQRFLRRQADDAEGDCPGGCI